MSPSEAVWEVLWALTCITAMTAILAAAADIVWVLL